MAAKIGTKSSTLVEQLKRGRTPAATSEGVKGLGLPIRAPRGAREHRVSILEARALEHMGAPP